MMNRAYSLFEIKEVNEDARVISGFATTPATDRVGDVVMPEGAVFKLPLPLLWQHDSGQPIGWVTQAKVTKNGIEIVAEIAKGVSEEIDRRWALIKSGLVRGFSIGFRGIDVEQIPGSWGVIFKTWEWLETSTVTIPANQDATILSVKSIDESLRAASGREQNVDPSRRFGKSLAKAETPKPKEKPMAKPIAEQISAFEATRAAKAAELETIMTTTEGETLDAEAAEAADTLTDEIKAIDSHLKRLRIVESVKASAAKPVEGVVSIDTGAAARDPKVPAQVKAKENLAPGIGFARLARVKALAKLEGVHAREVAKQLYGENSSVYGIVTKAPVAAGATTTWLANLVGDETAVFADFVEFLRKQTILGRFGSNGVPSLRTVPFRVPLIGQTGGGTGYWVGEGKSKPLTSFDFSRTTLEPLKVANIAVATMEALRDSSPSAEVIIRDSLAAALRERLDTDFINPAKAADSGVSPASITNGISPISATGTGDADDVRTDIQAVFGAFIAANNAPTTGVWIMPATVALALSLMVNPLGQPEFPGINMNGGTFFGLPVIVSEYMPTITGGAYVALVNATDIYLADDGGVSVDMSREASLEMATDPTMNSDSPAEQTLVSMFQTNSVAFLAERTINWARRRSSAVALLSGVNWG